jgi:ribosomal protein L11 methyltransferase
VLQLLIECNKNDAEALSDWLEQKNAVSIMFTDKYDDAILEPDIGTTPLWANVVVQALFQEQQEAESALASIKDCFPYINPRIEPLPEQDWQRAWMSHFTPIKFGEKLWICPSWVDAPEPDAANLILDPGLAFGTGAHPTTSLCLSWIASADVESEKIIDFGCGSGILSLAALKLGAKQVMAVDIDEQALTATRQNAIKNEINDTQLKTSQPDVLNEKVDLLIANILLRPLISLKPRFRELLHDDGLLVVSGILEVQCSELIELYEDTFTHQSTTIQDEWALMVFKAK